jgi:hypothetical protein
MKAAIIYSFFYSVSHSARECLLRVLPQLLDLLILFFSVSSLELDS